ncbi:hypothetical protein Lal_00024013 [Lupinus albus]|nr:hypothetical protein Lal_00024013 [Lupinus albus]
MAYWFTNSYSEYQVQEPKVEPVHGKHHHHKKVHVSYITNYDETMAEEVKESYPKKEAETTLQRYQRARNGEHHVFASVDQEADAFIQIEHNNRKQLFKPMRDN